MSDLYKFGYTLDETIKTMRDVIDTGNHDRMFLDTYYWLKMLSEYREIGTVEECRKSVERQKPKEPTVLKQQHSDSYNCPKCGRNLILKCGTDWFGGQHYKSCPNCGQAIRWDENLEGMEDDA